MPRAERDARRSQDNLLQHAAHLARSRERTGRTITLALEPEPMCYLETIEELAPFLEQKIFARDAVARFCGLTGYATAEAEAALRRHLGICYDVCHAAVEFEDPAGSIAAPQERRHWHFQAAALGCAARCRASMRETLEQLKRFDDGVYLHQVVERRANGALVRFLDLAPAFATSSRRYGHEWRVHCHVPIFMDKLPDLDTTQDFLREILDLHLGSRHQSVISKSRPIPSTSCPRSCAASMSRPPVARELAWVRARLDA